MRRNRIIWLVVWILSLIVISFFGGPISYGFFAVVSLIPVVSIIYLIAVYVLFHIYQRIETDWPVANQMVPFYFTLVNDYYLIFSGIRIKFYSSFSNISGLDEETEYELFPGNGITKETSLVCKYRGEYEVGIKTVIIQDFFRLFCFSYHNREPLRVVVKPQLVHLNNLKNENINMAVRETKVNASEPDVLVRKYIPGDDMRQMHWNVSAKSGELMVRSKIGEEQQGIGILLSTHRCGKDQFEYLPTENKMLEATLALALYFVKAGMPVAHFHTASHLESRRITNLAQFDEYYNFISNVVFDENKKDELLFIEATKNRALFECKVVFMILHELNEAALQTIQILNENNIYTVACIVNDSIAKGTIDHNMTRVEIINISPEDNLEEVL